MADIRAIEGNAVMREAGLLHGFLERRDLAAIDGRSIGGAVPCRPAGPMLFYRLEGFMDKGARKDTLQSLQSAGSQVLSAARRSALPAAFVAARESGTVGVYFGMGGENPPLQEALAQSDLNLRVSNAFLSSRSMERLCCFGAVLSGSCPPEAQWLDGVLEGMGWRDFLLAAVMEPVSAAQCAQMQEIAAQETARLRPWRTIGRSVGRDTRRSFDVAVPEVEEAIRSLARWSRRLETGEREGLWQCALWCCAPDETSARRLAALVSGRMQAAEQTPGGRCATLLCEPEFAHSGIALPSLKLRNAGAFEYTPMADGLAALWTQSELTALCTPPMGQYPGYEVIRQDHAASDRHLFDLVPPRARGRSAELGYSLPGRSRYPLDLDAFRSHGLIAGINGAGKSNTTMNLIDRFYEAGIPFGIIEPAKKEYWSLIDRIPIRLYSAGDDALPLRFNPLCPAAGELIGNHIEGLMLAFQAQSLMESPIPEVLRGLLASTYEEFGLDTGARMPAGARAPTLQDVADRVEGYVRRTTQYSDRVQKDVLSATKVRIESLLSGAPGRMLGVPEPLDVEALFESNFVIELDDISGKAESFVTSVLMLLINQYLRARKESGRLERIILLEEAHRYFLKTGQVDTGSAQGECQTAAYFSNLLSEIRAHGTGLLIVDQRPGELNSNAIANTAVKIVHALASENDAQAVAFALGLSDAQMGQLRRLGKGEALVGIIGENSVCRVQMDLRGPAPGAEGKPLCACTMCPAVRRCVYGRVREKISDMDLLYGQDVMRGAVRGFDALERDAGLLELQVQAVMGAETFSRAEKLCTAGLLMENTDVSFGLRRSVLRRWADRQGKER